MSKLCGLVIAECECSLFYWLPVNMSKKETRFPSWHYTRYDWTKRGAHISAKLVWEVNMKLYLYETLLVQNRTVGTATQGI